MEQEYNTMETSIEQVILISNWDIMYNQNQFWPKIDKFPWFRPDQVEWLEKKTAHLPEGERQQTQQGLYRELLPRVIAKQRNEQRMAVKNEYYQKNLQKPDKERQLWNMYLRQEDLADIVKSNFGLKHDLSTEDTMKGIRKYMANDNIDEQYLLDYLNGKNDELLYQLEIKERKPEGKYQSGALKGMLSRAGGNWGIWEWVNPIGRATEYLDDLIQKIPAVSFEGREEELRKRIDAVGEEERKAFEETFKNNRTLQALYGNVDNYIKESKKSFMDQFLGIGDEGPNVVKQFLNIPWSFLKTASWISRAMTNPLDTVVGLKNLLTTEEWRQLVIDRYWTNFQQTLEEDPIGLASDILTLVEWWASLWAKGAKLARLESTASKLSNVSKASGIASDLGLRGAKGAMMGQIDKLGKMGKAWKVVGTALELTQEPLKTIGKISEPLKEWFTRDIPEKVVENQMKLTPRERATVEATGITPAQFVLKENIGWLSKSDKVGALQNIANDAYKAVSDWFSKIPETEIIKNSAFKEMLGVMIDEMSSSSIIVRKYKDFIETLKKLEQADWYTPQEWLAIRRDFDAIVGKKIFDKQGRVSWLENQIIAEYRSTASDVLEEVAQKYWLEMKEQNSRIRNAITIRDGLLRSISQSKKNNYFWLQDLGIGGIGAMSTGDPITALWIIWAKKWAEKYAPWISQKLFNLNKKPLKNQNIKKWASFIDRWLEDGTRFNISDRSLSNTTPPQWQELRVESLKWNIERSDGKRGLDKLREWAETKYQLAEPIKSENFKKWFGDWENDPKNASKVVNEKGEPLLMYHGSPEKFTIFDSEFMSLHGSSKGYGFYFSPDKNMAQWYGDLMQVYLDIKNPLSKDKLSISRKEMKNLILDVEKNIAEKWGSEDGTLLDNFGDTRRYGRDRVLEDAIDMLMENENDVDVFGELKHIGGDYDSVAKSFRRILKKRWDYYS